MKIGDTVMVDSRHWKRANARATIVKFDGSRGDNHWLCEFDEAKIGGGFKDELGNSGKCLWLSDGQLTVEDAAKRKG